LGGAAVVALVILVVVTFGEGEPRPIEIASLMGGLGATIAVAGLVAARSSRAMEEAEREERARPAREQLADLDAHGADAGVGSYVRGMERWTTSLLELIDHAIATTDQPEVREELTTAREDTDALRSLLHGSAQRDLTLNEAATLHSVCALWETNQDRIEDLAAAVDLGWHRRWRARAVVARLLRHGPPLDREVVLPYRS
jgi:hypothetical protein